jgi:plastocyanin
MRRHTCPVLALASLAALLPAAPAAAAAPHSYTVVIDKMKFGAVPAQVRVGDSIMWVNRDILRHTATDRKGSFNADLPPGAKARTIVSKAGAIAFYCKYHPGMVGALSVSGK